MFVLSLISFATSILYLYFGFYVLLLNPRLLINRLFFLMNAGFCVWAFGYTFIFMTDKTAAAFFWYRFSSIGWCLVPGILLHFIIVYTERIKRGWFFIFPAIYLPGLLFIFRSFTGVLYAGSFEWTDSGIIERGAVDSPWFWCYLAYNFACLSLSLVFTLRYYRSTMSYRQKKQCLLIIISIALPMLFTYLFNIASVVYKLNIPVIGHVSFVLGVAGMWYAIIKYNLMAVTSTLAAEKIVAHMMDLFFLTDPSGKIIRYNNQVEKILGYDMNELVGSDFKNITAGEPAFEWQFAGRDAVFNRMMNLGTRSGLIVPVNMSASLILDDFNEQIGVVIVGHDIRERLELVRKNEIIELELRLAKKIQKNIIPSVSPVVPGMEIAMAYRPMTHLGGDFYDFLKVRESDLLGVFIGDVSGHGVPAALITSMLKTLLDASGVTRLTPGNLLKFVNASIIGQMGGNFLTAFYCMINIKEKKMYYARGAHVYPFLIRDGGIIELKSRGGLIGVMEDAVFEEKETDLKPGDRLFLFTDGLLEAENSGKEFFSERLPDLVLGASSGNVHNLVSGVIDELMKFMGDRHFEDDFSMIGIEIK
ncbi:MAG: SpoIIE family protein phosphatase [Spirochaetes bacterium]|jgi:PAS domain S-box-containing protein|nr:SpoIIE family protein phosphatase [Spirochaetota bacterium]